ncbi:MAG: hypothetical protein ACI8TQ_001852 [Planctomycetota bacterium]|jgi:hypothetical protein
MILEVIFKWALIICTYRIWWPILKVMWHELQAALWREGGLLGRTPTGRELQVLEERYGNIPSPLISETFAEYKLREEQEQSDRTWRKKQGISESDDEFGASTSDVMQPAARRSNQGGPGGGAGSGFPSANPARGGSRAPAPRTFPSASSSTPRKGGF